jgi:hypothetical protein
MNFGPTIVTSNLVLCLDAANKKSYPGTGNNWGDLISNSNAVKGGANTIAFNNLYFRFPEKADGDADAQNYFNLNKNGLLSGTEGCIFAWARFVYTGDKTNRYIFVAVGDSTNRFYLNANFSGSPTTCSLLATRGNPPGTVTISNSIPINTWFFAGIGWYNSNTVIGFLNGYQSGGSASFTNPSESVSFCQIGQQGGVGRVWPGDIAMLTCYNRLLTSSEVLQNYNASKTRFGL